MVEWKPQGLLKKVVNIPFVEGEERRWCLWKPHIMNILFNGKDQWRIIINGSVDIRIPFKVAETEKPFSPYVMENGYQTIYRLFMLGRRVCWPLNKQNAEKQNPTDSWPIKKGKVVSYEK